MKYLRNLIYLFSFVYSPLIYLLIKLLVLIKTIRITPIMTNRYGHLAANPEYYLLENKNYKKNNKYLDVFFTSRLGICNSVLLNLWKKKILIIPYYWIESTYKIFIKLETKKTLHTIPNFTYNLRFFNYNYNNYKPPIFLDDNQKNFCKEILKKQDIDIENIKFVCLFNRDHAYHNSSKYKKDWYYSSHQNYKINTFKKTAKKLAERNIYVFRMGKTVEEKFDLDNFKVIDYANSTYKSDLMDIYLASNCLFGIHCGTGNAAIAILFRKPLLDLTATLHDLYTNFENSILLTKHYYDKNKRRNLTLKEILNFKFNEVRLRQQFDEKNIEIIDCTEDEIAEAALELLDRLERKWIDSKEILDLQNKFKQHNWKGVIQEANGIKTNCHGKINANYSSNYLIKNPNWLK